MIPSGLPRSEGSVKSLSYAIAAGLKGIIAIGIPTEWGDPYVSKLIGSWIEFQKNFGGLLAGNDGPLYAKQMLDNGTKLRVFRMVHLTDVTDRTTSAGVKATGNIGGNTNGWDFEFPYKGFGGNRVAVTLANGGTGLFDITVSISGMTSIIPTVTVKGLKADGTNIAAINAQLPFPVIKQKVGTPATFGSVTLSGGTETFTDIVAADYAGDTAAGTGIHALDENNDFVKVAFPAQALRDVDATLSAYVTMRMDCLGVVRTPIGLTGTGAIDYRNGTGAYAGGPQAIDNWQMLMTFGGLNIIDPLDASGKIRKNVSEIGFVLNAMSNKDNNAKEWSSFAGYERGRIQDRSVVGVVYNVGTAARKLEADSLYEAGIIPVIKHESFGVTIWGDRTMYKGSSIFLRKAEVAELIISILRSVKPAVDRKLFDANHIGTWKAIYRDVKAVMDPISDGNGVWGDEGDGWIYQGDQDISMISQAVINTPDNIDAGQYLFNLWLKPVVNMDYVGFQVGVTSSGVEFTQLTGQPQ